MTSGGKRRKPGEENSRRERPRIKVIAIEEREGMPWFRELRGADGALYRIYHRRGEMYGFNVKTEELVFERKEGDQYDGMSLDVILLENVADIFEFVEDVELISCIQCFEKYPDAHAPVICDQCVCPTQIWTVTEVLPIEYEKLPFPLEYRHPMHDQFRGFRGSWSQKVYDEILRGPLVSGWTIQNADKHECHVVYTDKFLISFLSERDKNGDPVGVVIDLRGLERGEAKSLSPSQPRDLQIKPLFDFPEKLCPTCYSGFDFFETSCPKCGAKDLP